jgi:hypothetical protein
MSELAETVERVVREVLASLGHNVVAAGTGAAEPRSNGAAAAPAPQADSQPAACQDEGDSLVLNRRVVTLADLPERTETLRRVIVPHAAVITPAVRDELRQRQIKLIIEEPGAGAAKPVEVILMVAAAPYDPAPLAGALERDGFAVVPRHMDCLIRATDQLAADLKSGSTLAVLATAHPTAAVCLANRHAGVRAILGTRADTVAAESASVGANLLVIDPTAMGFFAVKQLAGGFLRGGPRACPEVFQKRLG